MINKRFKSLSFLIGNTPLLEIHFKYKGRSQRIFAKAEHLNFTGSIKDRMAFYIINRAYSDNRIKPGDMIIEATSGNTGISFSGIGRALNHPVTIFMPDWMSRERVDLIQSLGAKIRPVTREEGGFVGSIQMTEDMCNTVENSFLPCQFANEDNVQAHYETTGPEIWWQLKFNELVPDAFVAGVGTGGTVMGVGKYFKEVNPNIKIHPMEPASSPTLSTGYKIGQHRIQGISDDFIPPVVDLDFLDEVIPVDDGDSIIMAQKLSKELGLAVGISSGANFIAALKIQEKMGHDAIVTTVFADDNKKYLSTDLMRDEPIQDHYLSTDVELTMFEAHKRVCQTCCDIEGCNQKMSCDSPPAFKA